MTSKAVKKSLKKGRKVKGIFDDIARSIIDTGKGIIRPLVGKGKLRSASRGTFLAPYARNPMKPFKLRSSGGKNGVSASTNLTGTDLLCSVTIPTGGCDVGTILVNVVANPYKLGISRLAAMAPLFQRYMFKQLSVEYQPVVNATTDGQLMGYFSYDVKDDPTGTSGVDNLKRAAAQYGEKPVQVWQGAEKKVSWDLKRVDNLTDLYCKSEGKDDYWTDQGRFIVLAATEFGASLGGTTLGNLYVHYNIDFFVPQQQNEAAVGHTNVYGPTALYDDMKDCADELNATALASNDIPAELVYMDGANYLLLPAGRYFINFTCNHSGGTAAIGTAISATAVVSPTLVLHFVENNLSQSTDKVWDCQIDIEDTTDIIVGLGFTPTGSETWVSELYVSCIPTTTSIQSVRKYGAFKYGLKKKAYAKRIAEAKEVLAKTEVTPSTPPVYTPLSTASSLSSASAVSSASSGLTLAAPASTTAAALSAYKRSVLAATRV